ncbi:protein tipE isoform X3 [Penaeus vannamei]|uniref:protein tipE isoform X3 n=1 Tax=Penaeus vannamei TaxID=6689 RepID=UPI00387F40ED
MEDARLFPNVKGCGYPPSVNCTTFNMSYSTPGRTYPCYYSKEQPTTVLTSLDIEGITTDLIYAIVIPWGAFLVSILYLLITYVGMKKPDSDGDAPQEVTSAKASKEASNYSLRSIGKTINHGMNKLMGEPDDKGSLSLLSYENDYDIDNDSSY